MRTGDARGLSRQTHMTQHRSALLSKPCHVEHNRGGTIHVCCHAKQGPNGQHTGSTYTGDHNVPAAMIHRVQ